MLNNKYMIPARLLSTLFLALLLAACGGGGGDSPDPISGASGGGGTTTKPDGAGGGGSGGGGDDGGVIIEDPPGQEDITVTNGNIRVFIPGRSLLAPVDVAINATSIASQLPLGFTQIGDPFALAMSEADQDALNGPVEVTVTYVDQAIISEDNVLVLGYNGTDFEPVTVHNRDQAANTLTFDTRRFHSYVVVETDAILPAVVDTGFLPALNGWGIDNFGTYFAPGGGSFGMAGYAAWFYSNESDALASLYQDTTAQLTAARVQMSQAETWGNQEWRAAQTLPDPALGLLVKTYLHSFQQPLVLLLGQGAASLAVTVHGFDLDGFQAYDPDRPGEAIKIPFTNGTFGQYNGLDVLGYAALASYGRDGDFSALAQQAAGGFAGTGNISVDTPQQGQQIAARETELTGSLFGNLASQNRLYVEVKGVGRQVAVTGGDFSNTIEISNGLNTIVLLAGVDASATNNWFRDAPTAVLEVEGTLPPAILLVTLTWEQDDTDVDLYIREPDGETMWFGGGETGAGLELDFDDTTGFGPEHGTLEAEGTDQLQDGEYIIRVHYFSDSGLGVPATGRVSIVINEGQQNQTTRTFRFRINTADASASGPEGSGPSWVTIANVNVLENTISVD